MSMNANEIKSTARMNTIALLMPVLEANNAVKFADGSFAILQNVDGVSIWTSVDIKSKQYKATKISEAFDPHKAAEEWIADKNFKATEREKKAAAKADKIAKDKAKRN